MSIQQLTRKSSLRKKSSTNVHVPSLPWQVQKTCLHVFFYCQMHPYWLISYLLVREKVITCNPMALWNLLYGNVDFLCLLFFWPQNSRWPPGACSHPLSPIQDLPQLSMLPPRCWSTLMKKRTENERKRSSAAIVPRLGFTCPIRGQPVYHLCVHL